MNRTAAQSYMENEKRQQKSPLKENENKKKYHHNRHTESTNENYRTISDDDEKLFDVKYFISYFPFLFYSFILD